ncbi:MAG TPA: 16S rRNA (guanine(966)-N(2))-methyltransferase RsmD [Ktedonobacteraceae bacterium]|jgi:16S rRNA (guanine(966)-N(2))-methyltransferase RsmD
MRVVTGSAKGRKLKGPKTPGTRPIINRVKTALFDILSWHIEQARFLDLFAGTGGVGIEALSRGAASATFIEFSLPIVRLIRENLRITGLSECAEVLHMDAFKFLQAYAPDSRTLPHTSPRLYDMIYVAPPQYQELGARALGLLDNSSLLAEDGLVIVQIHPKELPGVAAVPLKRLVQSDERRYGSTLLLFFHMQKREIEIPHGDTPPNT